MKNFKVGIQLYTVREPLKEDFKGVLRELVKLGCDGVEFAFNFGGMSPEELATFTREIKLNTCGIHVSADQLADPASDVFSYAKALGCKYLTISHGGPFDEKLDEIVEICNQAGENAAAHQLQFTYHNHAKEFVKVDGVCAMDLLYQRTNSKQVMFELDVYWVTKGEQDPLAYIKKFGSRLPQLHMKDMDPADGSFTELGNGIVDLGACIAAAENTICDWLIYEQDSCKRPQFESAKISIAHLNKLLGR